MRQTYRFQQVPVDKVADFWDARPCNVRHSTAPVGTRQYFDEVEARRYFVEPHIPIFGEFSRWSGKKSPRSRVRDCHRHRQFCAARRPGDLRRSFRETTRDCTPACGRLWPGKVSPILFRKCRRIELLCSLRAIRLDLLFRCNSPHAASGIGAAGIASIYETRYNRENHGVRSARECIGESGVEVLPTPWQEFLEVPTEHWAHNGQLRPVPHVVIDCWRALDHLNGVDGVSYVRLGSGGATERRAEVTSSARSEPQC